MIKAIKVLRNWQLYPLVYYGLIKKDHVILETRSDFKIKIRTNSTDLMAFTHVWLIGEYSKPDFEVNDDDLIIDVGAHIGLFALLTSQNCKKGKIFCYEPTKENYDLLLKNIQDNQLTNVFPFNYAVSDTEQTVKVFLSSDQAGHSMYTQSKEFLEVQSTTLQKIIVENKINKCNFLKLDCEGAEYGIIDSLPDSYFDKIEKMVIEYHFADSKPELLARLQKRLEDNSYKITVRPLFDDIGFLYATRSS